MEAIWVGVTDQRPLGEVPAGAIVVSEGGPNAQGAILGEARGAVMDTARGPYRTLACLDWLTGGYKRRGQRKANTPCRLAVKARVLRVHDAPKEELAPAAEPARSCAFIGCDKTFRSPIARKRYCSNSCRAKATRARKNDTGKPRACTFPGCAKALGPQASKYCSPRCSSKAARAAQLEAAASADAAPVVEADPVVEAGPGDRFCGAMGCDERLTGRQKRYCSKRCSAIGNGEARQRGLDDFRIQRREMAPSRSGAQVVIDGTAWEVNAFTVEEAIERARVNTLKATRRRAGVVDVVSRGFGGRWNLTRREGHRIEVPSVFQSDKREIAAMALSMVFGAEGRSIMEAWDRANQRRAG